ncbi:MAG: YaiI/YqxD family protein [Hyphomonadaceae bacterium]|nr:YaiI/YqxD family protein [Clostridia bacterium]
MNILVDADACPVKEIILAFSKGKQIPVILFCDTAHILKDDYAQVITVDQGPDMVDMKLFGMMQKGDMVVTQDYGLAALCLGKSSLILHPNGFLYTSDNIEKLLFERFLSAKSRRAGKRGSTIPKRTEQLNIAFKNLLEALVNDGNSNYNPVDKE